MSTLDALIAYCRPGFEKECGAEIGFHMQKLASEGFFHAKPESGFVLWKSTGPVMRMPVLGQLVFSRQVFAACSQPLMFDPADRATPLAAALKQILNDDGFLELFVESPDTNEGKELSRFCKSLTPPILKACENAGLKKKSESLNRLHVFLPDNKSAYFGVSDVRFANPFEIGVVRLKFPPAAPSRSTLKLEEAFHTFLSAEQRQSLLQPGMRAVDLGASPGGWTYQFVRRKIKVIAVDNGKMDEQLVESGLVTVIASNGLTYTPREPVDWLVCDMIETPARVCETAVRWFERGLCERAVITLKLPMKKRLEEVQTRLSEVKEKIKAVNGSLVVKAKHLYHNRDEVTLYIG